MPILIKLKININNLSNNYRRCLRKQKAYNYKKANWDEFKRALPNDFDKHIGNDVNKLEDFIRKSLTNAADLTIPTFTNNDKK
jgi:hypothetical protein